jgi:hypothetical protein
MHSVVMTSFASALAKAERIKLKGVPAHQIGDANPHPTLSLAKGQAEERFQ